jgi:hypothetical protein
MENADEKLLPPGKSFTELDVWKMQRGLKIKSNE